MEIVIIEQEEGDAEFIEIILDRKIGELKFLITQELRDRRAYLFSGLQHYGVYVEKTGKTTDDNFVGAGLLKTGVAEWGSDSCAKPESLGRDRPEDSVEAERILGEFREALQNLMSLQS